MCTTVRWHLAGDESSSLKRNFDRRAHVESGGDYRSLEPADMKEMPVPRGFVVTITLLFFL